MSRKTILSFAAATIAVSASPLRRRCPGLPGGRGFGGGRTLVAAGFGGGASQGPLPGQAAALLNRSSRSAIPSAWPDPSHGHPSSPGPLGFHPHGHGHWVFGFGRWIVVDDVVDEGPAPVIAAPGPCTCLTKNYTPSGLVVFADVCTKESASASVDGRARDANTDHAGRRNRSADDGRADHYELRRQDL